jgi:uncharacterized membrane protein
MEIKKMLGLPSWGLAIITAFVSLIFLFFFSALLGSLLPINENSSEGFSYVAFGIIIAAACYLICKHDPKSVWYVPILCNALGILSAIVEPNFWITDLWIFVCCGWVLSIIGATIGAVVGHRSIQRN